MILGKTRVGRQEEAEIRGTNPQSAIQIQKVLGPQRSARTPFPEPPLFGKPPRPRLRVFHDYFSVPPSYPLPPARRNRRPRSQELDFAPSHSSFLTFVRLFLLSLPPLLSSSRPPSLLLPSPPVLPPPSPLRPLPRLTLAPLRSQPRPQPIRARPPVAPPFPGDSGRAGPSPGRGCGGRRRGAGADGSWRTGGAGAGLAWTRVCGAVRGRGGRCGPPGMGQPWPGGAEPKARAARGPGLPSGRPGG